jgi:hypothetical protein
MTKDYKRDEDVCEVELYNRIRELKERNSVQKEAIEDYIARVKRLERLLEDRGLPIV